MVFILSVAFIIRSERHKRDFTGTIAINYRFLTDQNGGSHSVVVGKFVSTSQKLWHYHILLLRIPKH